MKIRTSLITLFVLAAAACNSESGADSAALRDETNVGTLQLALTGVDRKMQQYRLRDATFDIQGTRYTDYQSVFTTVSSETDLDSPVVRERLFYGYYSVSMRPDTWYIERLTPTGAERVQQAVLISTQWQPVSIQQGAVSQVAFQLGVDGELIDFLGGDLEIGISIEQAPGTADAGGG